MINGHNHHLTSKSLFYSTKERYWLNKRYTIKKHKEETLEEENSKKKREWEITITNKINDKIKEEIVEIEEQQENKDNNWGQKLKERIKITGQWMKWTKTEMLKVSSRGTTIGDRKGDKQKGKIKVKQIEVETQTIGTTTIITIRTTKETTTIRTIIVMKEITIATIETNGDNPDN